MLSVHRSWYKVPVVLDISFLNLKLVNIFSKTKILILNFMNSLSLGAVLISVTFRNFTIALKNGQNFLYALKRIFTKRNCMTS
jgi:hypothetical protein